MAGPVYKLFLCRFTEAWYQLSKEEQDQVVAAEMERSKQTGCKTVIFCDCSWSAEQWMFFGVEEYPDIESVQRVVELQREVNWGRYMQGISFLGTKMEEE